MKAELSDVEEAKLVALAKIKAEEFDHAVLSNSQSPLNTMSTSTIFAFFGKFNIHLLDSKLKHEFNLRIVFLIITADIVSDESIE